jgi:hypothetical protein
MQIVRAAMCASAILIAASLGSPSYAECVSPQGCDYKLDCEIENLTAPGSELFAPGDEIRVSVDIDVPNAVAELQCELSAFIQATILNHDFLGEISRSTFIVDDCAARQAQPFVDRLDGNECEGKTELYETEFTLPDDMPNSTGSLLAKVKCGQAGKAGRTECRQDIEIER